MYYNRRIENLHINVLTHKSAWIKEERSHIVMREAIPKTIVLIPEEARSHAWDSHTVVVDRYNGIAAAASAQLRKRCAVGYCALRSIKGKDYPYAVPCQACIGCTENTGGVETICDRSRVADVNNGSLRRSRCQCGDIKRQRSKCKRWFEPHCTPLSRVV